MKLNSCKLFNYKRREGKTVIHKTKQKLTNKQIVPPEG